MVTIQAAVEPQPIDDFSGWLDAFLHPSVLLELFGLALCALLAWFCVATLRRAFHVRDKRSIWFGESALDGVFFPLVLLCLAYVLREVMGRLMPVAVLKLALPVLMSLLLIRIGAKVLHAAFWEARWVRALEQTISWMAWGGMVLWVSGLAPAILNELDQITWKVGGSTLSVLTVLEGILTAGAVLIVTLWMSAGIEARLLRSATGDELSLRKAVSNATRALLLFVGMLVALSAVGIDLTALSVLGGAVGVGIGFGLQKLASNYVSGFVILAERSMRIGDQVRVDTFEGAITQINARYTVIRALSGRESIVPNELLITSRVENLSLGDKLLYQSTALWVAHDADVLQVQTLLTDAALAQARVLREPAPAAQLSNFGGPGLEFTLGYWISDPENGTGNLRSDIHIAVLAAMRARSMPILFAQSAVQSLGPSVAAPAPAPRIESAG